MTDVSLLQTGLDAIGDIYYIIDKNNTIIAAGPPKVWQKFSNDNGGYGPSSKPNTVVGHNLFSFVSNERTKQHYQRVHNALWTGKKDRIIIKSMCDAPEKRRPLRQSLSVITKPKAGVTEGEPVYIVYQCCVWDEVEQPPIHLLNCPTYGFTQLNAPMLNMCSYCKFVQHPIGNSDGNWIPPHEYYALGGTNHVLLSHGCCPLCLNRLMAELDEDCDMDDSSPM
eukprot:TRINITY_DN1249_c0_g1_i2.p1 TRINITY_DN1249_c0_g1~~TRINITY_DN1249_c0_g1_i2.p1  ORF type:complete len:224 (+),score=17.42 TRINITY_DN1249_c0_g1_i2:94-765(+)